MGPAVYYISNPIGAMLAVYLVCAAVVYCLVPAANKAGIKLNPKANRQKATQKAVLKLEKVMQPLMPGLGLTWSDIEDAGVLETATLESLEDGGEDPHFFIEGELAFSKPLATKMCIHRARKESHLASLSRRVRLTWECITANPELLTWGMDPESLHEAATQQMSPSLLETFAKRALAWKNRKYFENEAKTVGADLLHVAVAVSDAYDSATDLYVAAEKQQESFKNVCKAKCAGLRPGTKASLELSHKGKDSANTVDIETLDFGLFSSLPRPGKLFIECIPVFWVMLLAMWPTLLSNFLKLIWCVSILEDNDAGITVTFQRLKPDPELICWSRDHMLVAMITFAGLGVWCVGVPLLLFSRIWALNDRQSPDNNRKYGFFIQGYEPQFWWWDIIVKRLDVLTMNLVTYTSLAADEKAKLLLFPILSGCQLGIFSWYKPFTEVQGGILDVLEMSLLITRFSLFSVVSIILIFSPSTVVTMILAGSLVALMALTCAYFGLHIVAQFLRGAAEDMKAEESSDKKDASKSTKQKKPKGMANLAVSLKKFALNTALPLFLPADDETLFLQWSIHTNGVEVVSAAEMKAEDDPKVTHRRCCGSLVSCCKAIRASVLRLGPSVERQNLGKAISEFCGLWLDGFDQTTLPTDIIHVLCILAETSGYVPSQTPLAETAVLWLSHARSHLHSELHIRHMSADSLVETRQRLLKLGAQEAVKLVNDVQGELHAHKKKLMAEPAAFEKKVTYNEEPELKDTGWDLSPVSHGSKESQRPMMADMAMQTIQSSFVKKALLPSQGDQIQVQVLEMAVRELKPDAEPPALDSPETDLIDAADAVVLPAPRPKAMVKGPSPRPAPRAVPTAPRPAPSDETPSSSQPVPTSPTRLPASPTSAPKRMPPSQVGRSIKTAARPSPDVIVSPSAVAADVNQPVRLERQMTSETEEEEEEPSDEEQ